MNRAALSRVPWPVILVFFLVILPPVLTMEGPRRYRVLPNELSVAFTTIEAIVVAAYVIAVLFKARRLSKIAILAFCGSGILMNLGGLSFLIGMMLDPHGLDGRRLLVSAIYLWSAIYSSSR